MERNVRESQTWQRFKSGRRSIMVQNSKPLFSETNKDIVLTSENADLSFKGVLKTMYHHPRMKRVITS